MKKYSKITPEGTRDFLFEECDVRRNIEVSLSSLFKKRSYRKVITPTIEFYDVFNRDSAGMMLEDMYKLTDNRGRLLVMRPDNTMPIARMVATRLDKPVYPLRLYYNQSVFVNNESLTGRNNEISQTGIELIGVNGKRADIEVITMAHDALKCSGAKDFRIEIGHAGFFNAILKKMDVSQDILDDICKLTETKNYAALKDLLDKIGDSEETRAINMLPRLFGGVEVIEKASKIYSGKKANEALNYLKNLYSDLSALGLEDEITIDLGIVNRSNYYTGIVFRGYIQGSGITALSGGRYDNLISEFGLDIPAIGFGVDVNSMAQAKYATGEFIKPLPTEKLIFAGDGFEIKEIEHSRELFNKNIKNEVFLGNSLDDAKEYAEKRLIKEIDIINENGIETLKVGE